MEIEKSEIIITHNEKGGAKTVVDVQIQKGSRPLSCCIKKQPGVVVATNSLAGRIY